NGSSGTSKRLSRMPSKSAQQLAGFQTTTRRLDDLFHSPFAFQSRRNERQCPGLGGKIMVYPNDPHSVGARYHDDLEHEVQELWERANIALLTTGIDPAEAAAIVALLHDCAARAAVNGLVGG